MGALERVIVITRVSMLIRHVEGAKEEEEEEELFEREVSSSLCVNSLVWGG